MSSYKPPHDPPRWWERAITHSPLVIIALWSVAVGVQVAVDPFFLRQLFSVALGHQPGAIAVVMGLVMAAGSVTVLAGILTGMQNRSRAWAIERYGWWMSSATRTAYWRQRVTQLEDQVLELGIRAGDIRLAEGS